MTDKHIQHYDPFACTQSKILEARQLVSSSLTADALRSSSATPETSFRGTAG